jgi:hypothetical protein
MFLGNFYPPPKQEAKKKYKKKRHNTTAPVPVKKAAAVVPRRSNKAPPTTAVSKKKVVVQSPRKKASPEPTPIPPTKTTTADISRHLWKPLWLDLYERISQCQCCHGDESALFTYSLEHAANLNNTCTVVLVVDSETLMKQYMQRFAQRTRAYINLNVQLATEEDNTACETNHVNIIHRRHTSSSSSKGGQVGITVRHHNKMVHNAIQPGESVMLIRLHGEWHVMAEHRLAQTPAHHMMVIMRDDAFFLRGDDQEPYYYMGGNGKISRRFDEVATCILPSLQQWLQEVPTTCQLTTQQATTCFDERDGWHLGNLIVTAQADRPTKMEIELDVAMAPMPVRGSVLPSICVPTHRPVRLQFHDTWAKAEEGHLVVDASTTNSGINASLHTPHVYALRFRLRGDEQITLDKLSATLIWTRRRHS